MIPPCLTLSHIRYVSRVKWNNPGKGVAPSPTPRCSNYWKGNLLVALNYGRQLYFTYTVFVHLPSPSENYSIWQLIRHTSIWAGIWKKKKLMGSNYKCQVKGLNLIITVFSIIKSFLVSYVFRSLLNPNVLHLKTFIS